MFSRSLTDLCEWWAVERRGWTETRGLKGDAVWTGDGSRIRSRRGGLAARLGMQHIFVK